VGERENRIGEGIKDFEEMGVVDGGICCFFGECKLIQIWLIGDSSKRLGGGNGTEFLWKECGLGYVAYVWGPPFW